MKKRLLAIMLVVVMLMGMSTTAFAAKTSDYEDYLDKEPVISKTYVVENGTAPAETFTYTFEGLRFENNDGDPVVNATIPAIENQTISFDAISATETKTVSFDIDADAYELGVYTYKVTEVKGNTTGVTYSDEELYLVLTILRDEENGQHYVGAMHYEDANGTDKSTGFTNYYDAGSLEISKTITGNSADMEKKFNFNVIFTVKNGTKANSESKVFVNGKEYITLILNEGTTTCKYKLGHGDSVKFENLPEGIEYEIYEDAKNYTQAEVTGENVFDSENNGKTVGGMIFGTTYNGEGEFTSKVIEKDTATYENNLTNDVDTGIFTTNLPYILALVAIAGVAVVMFRRKREF